MDLTLRRWVLTMQMTYSWNTRPVHPRQIQGTLLIYSMNKELTNHQWQISPHQVLLWAYRTAEGVLDISHDNLLNKFICLTMDNFSESERMLDSRASRHHAFDINNFVEYRLLKNPATISTATAKTHAIGVGTVILLADRHSVWISPVLHVADITSKLSSMGSFFNTA